MPYLWDDQAWADYQYWLTQDKKTLRRINALVEVNGDEEYLSIINPLNELIERQKTVLSARKTNNAKQKEEDPAETTPPTEG